MENSHVPHRHYGRTGFGYLDLVRSCRWPCCRCSGTDRDLPGSSLFGRLGHCSYRRRHRADRFGCWPWQRFVLDDRHHQLIPRDCLNKSPLRNQGRLIHFVRIQKLRCFRYIASSSQRIQPRQTVGRRRCWRQTLQQFVFAQLSRSAHGLQHAGWSVAAGFCDVRPRAFYRAGLRGQIKTYGERQR